MVFIEKSQSQPKAELQLRFTMKKQACTHVNIIFIVAKKQIAITQEVHLTQVLCQG